MDNFISQLISFYTSEGFLKLVVTAILGFTYQQTLIFNKQNWIKTKMQTLNFILLPPIGFSITSSISSNIALSLGMVGALSIIRFRTPVKNPFELVSYFLLLSIGVISTVNIYSSIAITSFACFVIIVITFLENKNIFMNSSLKPEIFGNGVNYLDVTLKNEYEFKNYNVLSFGYSDKKFNYTISGTKGLEYIGADKMGQVPKGQSTKIISGRAFDVVGNRKVLNYNRQRKSEEAVIEIKVTNARSKEIKVLLVEHINGDWIIKDESLDYKKKDASTIHFSFLLNGGETKNVYYTYRKEWN